MMSQCPNCKSQELEGAIFCSQCGAQMVGLPSRDEGRLEESKNTVPLRIRYSSVGRTTRAHSMLGNDLSLHFLDSGQILPLSDSQEYILGRSSEDQPEKPSIDLTDYQAYEKGVSRLHASIRKAGGGFQIVDLGSSNGTRLNGNRLAPQQAYSLQHGDILSLGKLKVQILIRR